MSSIIDTTSKKAENIRPLQGRIISAYRKLKLSQNIAIPDSDIQVRGLLGGVRNLSVDIIAIGKEPKRAVSISTSLERHNLQNKTIEFVTELENIANILEQFYSNSFKAIDDSSLNLISDEGEKESIDFSGLLQSIDSLKIALRPFSIRFTSSHTKALNEQLSDIIRQCENIKSTALTASEYQTQIEELKRNFEESLEQINESKAEAEEILETFNSELLLVRRQTEEVTSEKSRFDTALAEAKDTLENIQDANTEAESHKELIESFSKRISKREDELLEQSKRTDDFNSILNQFKVDQASAIEDAKSIIDEARRALSISSEVSLGRHFADQYSQERNSVHWWLVSACVCLSLGLGIGIWAVTNPNANSLLTFFTRLSLVPIVIGAAIYCSVQYSNQKKLIADYAYKKVLALSLTGFREHFSNGTDSNWPVLGPKIMAEIHTHPLASRHPSTLTTLKEDEQNSYVALALEILKTANKVTSQNK